MSNHIEWGSAKRAFARIEKEANLPATDDCDPEREYLVITNENGDGIALEGTPEEWQAFATRLLQVTKT